MILVGSEPGVESRYFVILPPEVIRPILFPRFSVNQSAPSGPGVMPKGKADVVGRSYSVKSPPAVMRLILLPSSSVNQRVLPGPCVISAGSAPGVGMKNSLNVASTCLMKLHPAMDALTHRAKSHL